MSHPGALVILTPLIVEILFGVKTHSGVLAGSLVFGVQQYPHPTLVVPGTTQRNALRTWTVRCNLEYEGLTAVSL
ncbi:pyrophosphate-energized vacuolar membrane proton pump-like [Apium graveolens]|uniref:pyrophosphate-energized vacuolar membrane proton pump-like n=1 Tax=Apium graveolens TaxID=4045 RepID=UPI003D7A4A13